jgi:Domain of unknown function (DUF4258)
VAYEHEASRLRRVAQNPEADIWFRKHADEEMAKDDIRRPDVQGILKKCSVSKVEESGGELTYRVHGRDFDNRKITAEVVLYEDNIEIKVITAWKDKEEGRR